MSERVVVDRFAGVAQVRLNRPDKLNGLDQAMFEALIEAGTELARDLSLRAVVLSGEGRAFCAGLDFPSFMAAGEGAAEALLARCEGSPANVAQRAAWVWAEIPVPVIAALHGFVFGGGLQIALAADLRIVAPDAQLSVMEIQYGLIPDMAISRTLCKLLRPDQAKDLIFTGRKVSGTEALALGLATRLSDSPSTDALALAVEIAAKSPCAIRRGKRLVNETQDMNLAEALRFEENLQREILGKANQLEAVSASLAKRAAEFQDPE